MYALHQPAAQSRCLNPQQFQVEQGSNQYESSLMSPQVQVQVQQQNPNYALGNGLQTHVSVQRVGRSMNQIYSTDQQQQSMPRQLLNQPYLADQQQQQFYRSYLDDQQRRQQEQQQQEYSVYQQPQLPYQYHHQQQIDTQFGSNSAVVTVDNPNSCGGRGQFVQVITRPQHEDMIQSQQQTYLKQRQCEQNQLQQHQYPQSQYPQSQYPQSQYPQSQYPQSQYPQSQYPQSQSFELPEPQRIREQRPRQQQSQPQPETISQAPSPRRQHKGAVQAQPRIHTSLSTTERYQRYKNISPVSSIGDSGLGDDSDAAAESFHPYSFKDWLSLKARDGNMRSGGLGAAGDGAMNSKRARANEYAGRVGGIGKGRRRDDAPGSFEWRD